MALSMIRLNQQFGALGVQADADGSDRNDVARLESHDRTIALRGKPDSSATPWLDSAAATSQISTSVGRVVKKGLNPIHSRAKGNAKRLAKR